MLVFTAKIHPAAFQDSQGATLMKEVIALGELYNCSHDINNHDHVSNMACKAVTVEMSSQRWQTTGAQTIMPTEYISFDLVFSHNRPFHSIGRKNSGSTGINENAFS